MTDKASRPEAGLSATEIEITPIMIDAGFSVLSYGYDPDAPQMDRRVVVRDMYLAMIAAKSA